MRQNLSASFACAGRVVLTGNLAVVIDAEKASGRVSLSAEGTRLPFVFEGMVTAVRNEGEATVFSSPADYQGNPATLELVLTWATPLKPSSVKVRYVDRAGTIREYLFEKPIGYPVTSGMFSLQVG